jgi:hypothetical protein
MMPDRNQRSTIQFNRQYFEEHVHHGLVSLVEYGVVYIAGLKEEIAGAVNDGLIRQVWLGRVSLSEALRKRQIRLEGDARRRPSFLGLVRREPDGRQGARCVLGSTDCFQ